MYTDANGMHEVYEILVVVSPTELTENFREILVSVSISQIMQSCARLTVVSSPDSVGAKRVLLARSTPSYG